MWIERFRASREYWVVMLFAALAALVACVGPIASNESEIDQLRSEIAADLGVHAASEIVIPHEISDQTRAALDARVAKLDRSQRNERGLIALLFGPDQLDLAYEWATTRDADSTIRAGGGNCLSLSAVLVAATRAYGGAARYVEIDSNLAQQQEGDLEIWSSHVAVLLAGREGPLIVDFLGARESGNLQYRILSDRSLVARFYNDRGYERIHRARTAGEEIPWEEARAQFEIATQIDVKLARAWNNLGVALTRLGEFEAAEQAYRKALQGQRDYPGRATVLNLANLETRRELARELEASTPIDSRGEVGTRPRR